MCGLVLLVTKHENGFSTVQQDIFASLLYLSGGFRGRDGVGVTVIDNMGNVNLAKDAGSVDTFLQTEEFIALNSLAYKRGRAMIGHNRAATRGEIKDTNAHPFVIDDKIVLVHNGTFYGSHTHIKDTEVDSEAIGHLLAENEDVEEALRKVNAAYALMWYNVDKKEINVVRNLSRPLYYLEINSSYIFASEESFLKFVIDKFSLVPILGPYMVKEYNLSSFTIKDDHTLETNYRDINCKYPVNIQEETPWEHYLTCRNQAPYTTNEDYYLDIFQTVVEHFKEGISGMCHGDWAKIIDTYKERETITVEPLYWVEYRKAGLDNNRNDYLIIGKTLDDNSLNVSFKMYNKTEEEVREAISKNNYTLAIARVTWRRFEDKFPVDETRPMNEWMGVVHVHGYDPKPFIELEHHVH